ncbi:MAG: hypothetical protein NC930_02560 [Candidatus Omnitrophica bacterium]|nr:hypothetical protein [Candidatus Omnitrophota bacterium]
MKPFDFQPVLFRMNVFITGIIFILLAPTTRIYVWWFPDKKDTLWLLPLSVIGLSSVVWLVASFSMPLLIKLGWVEDRRKEPRTQHHATVVRLLKMIFPILVFAVHMLVLIFFSASLIAFMRSAAYDRILINLP